MPGELNIEVPRNGHYFQQWLIADVDDQPINLTGHTLVMSARPIAGAGSVVASAEIAIESGRVGFITVKWTGSDFDAVDGETEIVRLAYDLKDASPDGITTILVRGQIILFPEVTA